MRRCDSGLSELPIRSSKTHPSCHAGKRNPGCPTLCSILAEAPRIDERFECVVRGSSQTGTPAVWNIRSSVAIALVACQRHPIPQGMPSSQAMDASGEIAMMPKSSGAQSEGGVVANKDPRNVALGLATSPVRIISFVQGDCQGKGTLDRSAFVHVEDGGGQSCEENRPSAACANLAGRRPIFEEAHFSPLCSLAAVHPLDLPAGAGGRPRDKANIALRQLVAKGAPCLDDPPGMRIGYQVWSDVYRSDGSMESRHYFGQASSGERIWFQELDLNGRITQEFTDCDAGHN